MDPISKADFSASLSAMQDIRLKDVLQSVTQRLAEGLNSGDTTLQEIAGNLTALDTVQVSDLYAAKAQIDSYDNANYISEQATQQAQVTAAQAAKISG